MRAQADATQVQDTGIGPPKLGPQFEPTRFGSPTFQTLYPVTMESAKADSKPIMVRVRLQVYIANTADLCMFVCVCAHTGQTTRLSLEPADTLALLNACAIASVHCNTAAT